MEKRVLVEFQAIASAHQGINLVRTMDSSVGKKRGDEEAKEAAGAEV